jgi:parvulin-like peptidyl-prolyl isomerase
MDARLRRALFPAVCLVLAACGKPTSSTDTGKPSVVAEVAGRSITVAELQAEAAHRATGRRELPAKEELLRELIQREQMLLRVREAGLDRDPAVRREIDNLLLRKLVAAEVDPRREAVAVTADEIRAEYESDSNRHTRPAQGRFAVLFLATGAKASETRLAEARARMDEARRRVMEEGTAVPPTSGTPGFGPWATNYSEDQASRHRGGDIGWVERGQHPPRFPEAVLQAGWDLATGAVSEVLEFPQGLYLIMKTDVRPESTVPLASVEAALRQTLLVRKRKAVEDSFRQELAGRFPVRIYEQTLASVNLPAPGASLAASNREPQPPGLPGPIESPHGN